MRPAAGARHRAQRDGVRAERVAAAWLRLKGYRVVARCFRSAAGEIDIIARRGGTLACVEVKYRKSPGGAAEAIDARKQRRLVGAIGAWLAAHPADAALAVRFDAVLIMPWRIPVHMEDAWRP